MTLGGRSFSSDISSSSQPASAAEESSYNVFCQAFSLNSCICRALVHLRPKYLAHFVGVEPAQVIALECSFDTISVALPEGNARLIARCRFQQDVAHAAQRQVPFAFYQQSGADAVATEFLSDVERDDVSQRRILLGQDKSGDVSVFHSHQAIGGADGKKV